VGFPEWMADAFNELQADGRTLPGGWADVDETPAEAAVREESGYLTPPALCETASWQKLSRALRSNEPLSS
jgi:hypothetical protein